MENIVEILLSMPDLLSSKGASIADICSAESELFLEFSEDYKQYVRHFGIVAYDGHELTGICKSSHLNVVDVTKAERIKAKLVPADFYVIEIANIDGIVIWQKSTGEIFKTVFDSPPTQICESFCGYIEYSHTPSGI